MKQADHDSAQSPAAVEELLRLAPMRESPPAGDMAVVREAVYLAWRQETHRASRRGLRWVGAAAAVLVLALVLVSLRDTETGGVPPVTVARAQGADGAIAVTPSGRRISLHAGSALNTGETLSTSNDAPLTLLWNGGIRVQMDRDSRLEVLSKRELHLARGRIYLDTGIAEPDARVTVVTPEGRFRHLGTRFQVQVLAARTEVWVREGRVALESGAGQANATEAKSGQRIEIGRNGRAAIHAAPTWGEPWAWVDAVSAPFQGDGRSVADLLDWLAHESGRRLVFASPEVQRAAGSVQLHGDLSLDQDDALSVVNATTDFQAQINGERIEVSLREP